MQEEWRPVVGFEGLYEVSNKGRVKSLDRIVVTSSGVRRNHPGRILKTPPNLAGYPNVHLRVNGGGRTRLVHNLVLEAFVGEDTPGMYGCHNDGDPGNNNLENLRYDTPSGNSYDKRRHGTDHEVNKTHCPRGHPLEPPNLKASFWETGRRSCLSCARARCRVAVKRGEVSLQEESDREYLTIMKEKK